MTLPTSRVIVRAEMVLAFEPIISKEETRYYLNGVHIQPHPREGVIIVATDGHRLAALHAEDAIFSGNAEIWSLDWKGTVAKAMQTFKKCDRKSVLEGNFYVELSSAGGTTGNVALIHAPSAAEAGDAGGTLIIQLRMNVIDGTFPEWRRVCPRDTSLTEFKPAWFQGKYLRDCAAFGSEIGAAFNLTTSTCWMTILSQDIPEAPAVIRYSGLPQAFMVLMPVRGDKSPEPAQGGLPDWLYDSGNDRVVASEIPPPPEGLHAEPAHALDEDEKDLERAA
jgi:hypothetical protein